MDGASGRHRRTWTARVTVPVLLAAYVAVLYVITVLAGRALFGGSSGAGFGLTVLAAAVAALTLEPLGSRLRRRLAEPPQDRLARLARGAVAAGDLPEVLGSTARLLQEGLAATSVEIHAAGSGTPSIVARATAGPAADTGGVLQETALDRSGRHWGRLLVALPAGTHLSPRDQALVAGVAEHLTTILQTAALRNALRNTVAQAEMRAGDLRRSRQRIVLTSHEGRRRVERDMHDGAQQHLVALAVYLGLVRSLVADRPSASSSAIETALSSARSALAALDELSSGLYPARLAEDGLLVALEQAARTTPLPVVVVSVDDLPRADLDVEAAVYFCCLEAMQNAAKHARALHVGVRLGFSERALTFAVTDDGHGFVPSAALAGTGMQNMRDRLEALAGSLVVASAPGVGTTVSGKVPAGPRTGPPRVPAPRSARPRREAEG